MIISLHPKNPNTRELKKAIDILNNNGVVIIPTDTIYALACKLDNKKAIERMCKIVGKKPDKVNFSLLCASLSHLSDYTSSLDKSVFRLMKNNLPGPFTFILKLSSLGYSSREISKIFAIKGLVISHSTVGRWLKQEKGKK